MTSAAAVLLPESPDEAIAAFGDGIGVTVIGGGTIVLPQLTHGKLKPAKALLLAGAGLAGISRDGSAVTIGATTSLADLVDLPAPLGPCAANVADLEIREQATLAGNLCAGESADAPRGDLQGPLLALDATVRSTGAGGERTQPLEEFLGDGEVRLVLSVSFEEPAAGAFAALDLPHAHHYTVLAVSAARASDGTVTLAATGAGAQGVRLRSAEAEAGDAAAAGQAALTDVTLRDDALASAWYRGRTLPVLVRRALAQLEDGA